MIHAFARNKKYLLPLFALILLLFMYWLLFTVNLPATSYEAGAACLKAGYPDYRFAGNDVYCVRLEAGTQVVRPLESLGE